MLKGEYMDSLINNLTQIDKGSLLLIYKNNNKEGNECTKSQTATMKNKGWTPYYTTEGAFWFKYNGSDDEPDNILLSTIENTDDNVPIYNIAGQRVTQPTKSGIYIMNGKKVLINK